ncbi:MAG TPA: hypothetical protein VF216_03030 [Mizugakiibacter sp.]
MVELGNEVKDVVTGFEGIATAKVEYLNGCVQFCVTPQVGADNKMPDGVYIDHQRLAYIGQGCARKRSDTGGVMRDAPNAMYRG